MKILPVFIRRRVIRIRFLNFLKKESHSFVLRGTVAMLFLGTVQRRTFKKRIKRRCQTIQAALGI